jgi:hypothetical protein
MQHMTFQKYFTKNTSIYNQLQVNRTYLDDPDKIADAALKHIYMLTIILDQKLALFPYCLLISYMVLLVPISDLNIQKAIK